MVIELFFNFVEFLTVNGTFFESRSPQIDNVVELQHDLIVYVSMRLLLKYALLFRPHKWHLTSVPYCNPSPWCR